MAHERSRLFRLDPIDAKWGMRESLISYIVRVAAAHSIRTRELIRRIYLPMLDNPGGALHSPFYRNQARTINGVGQYARTFSELTESLTTQGGLARHTLLPWRDLVPENGTGLIASHVRWCPACLVEQRCNGVPSHFPLLWSLDRYQVCHLHDRPMAEHCPRCGKYQQWIPELPDQTRCTACGCFLGHSGSFELQQPDARQRRHAHLLHDMLASDAGVEDWARHSHLCRRLMAAANHLADGQKSRLSEMLGLTRTSLSCWIAKGQRPAFPQLLHVCDAFGVGFKALLTSDAPLSSPQATGGPQLGIVSRRDSSVDLGTYLTKHLQSEGPPVSVATLAKQLGVSRSKLKYRHPDLVQAVSTQYRDSVASQATLLRQQEIQRVVSLTEGLVATGEKPTGRRLLPQLKLNRLSLRRRYLRLAYWSARQATISR